MKKLSLKAFVSLLLVFVLSFSVVYMPGMSFEASAVCANGCDYSAQKIGANYLKSESTCGKKAVYYYSCTVCGQSSQGKEGEKTFQYGTAPEHDWGPYESVAATCTEDAYQKHTCNRCKQNYIRKISGTALGHNWKLSTNETYKICTNCGTTTCEHSFVKVAGYVSPTCTEPGNDRYYKCVNCDVLAKDAIGTQIIASVAEVTIPATGHTWVDSTTPDYMICSTCNAKKYTDITPEACKHANRVYVAAKNPTCTEEGNRDYYRCTDCGKAVLSYGTGGFIDIANVTRPAIGHDWKDATCTAPMTCSLCGATEGTALGHDIEGIPATAIVGTGNHGQLCKRTGCGKYVNVANHNYVTVEKHLATCSATGTEKKKCTVCNDEKTETLAIDATAHAYGAYEIVKEATCTTIGLKKRVCIYNSAHVETKEIPALGHDYYTLEEEATCTENGYFEQSCSRCDYVNEEIIEAYGHVYEGTDLKFATCTEDGEVEYYCYRCEDTYTETIPATGHSFPEKWNTILTPNCQEKGVAIRICFGCHDVETKALPKTGHADKDGDSYCDTCNLEITVVKPSDPEKDNKKDEECSCNCHAGGIKAFFFKLTNFFAKIFNKDARTCECGEAH